MSVKGSWPRGSASSYCVRPCANRDKRCAECWKFDMWQPLREEKEEEFCQNSRRYIIGMALKGKPPKTCVHYEENFTTCQDCSYYAIKPFRKGNRK
jgi:hypothetical protein